MCITKMENWHEMGLITGRKEIARQKKIDSSQKEITFSETINH